MKKILLFLSFSIFLFASVDYLAFMKKEFESKKPKCQSGLASACFDAGNALFLMKQMGEKIDNNEIIKYFDIACKANISKGCQLLGTMYAEYLKEYEKAFNAFKKGCRLNDYSAPCWQVGQAYELGVGVEQDYKEAANFYEKSISLEQYFPSLYRLGLLYLEGKGVDKDKKKACKLLSKACKISGTFKKPCEAFKKCK